MLAAICAAIIIVNVGDVVSTELFLLKGIKEGNPVVAWFMGQCGYCWVVFKAFTTITEVLIIWYVGLGLLTYAVSALLIIAHIYVIYHNLKAAYK